MKDEQEEIAPALPACWQATLLSFLDRPSFMNIEVKEQQCSSSGTALGLTPSLGLTVTRKEAPKDWCLVFVTFVSTPTGNIRDPVEEDVTSISERA